MILSLHQLFDSVEVLSMNCDNMNFEVSLQSCPVAAVWAGVGFLPSMGEYVSS